MAKRGKDQNTEAHAGMPAHLRGAVGETAADTDNKTPWYKNGWLVFFVLILAAVGFRMFVFEAFKIPTGSMEPTLLGDANHGDRLFVFKMAYAFGRNPKRWEVAVFKPPRVAVAGTGRAASSSTVPYVKRVCGLPGDDLMVFAGDLWRKNDTTHRYEILRKPARVQDILWYPIWKFPPDHSRDRLTHFSEENMIGDPSDWIALSGTAGCLINEEGNILLDSARVDGDPVRIRYAYPITNLYVKAGRHFFNDRTRIDRPDETPFEGAFNRYVGGGWESVMTPPNDTHPNGVRIFPLKPSDFFWGKMSVARPNTAHAGTGVETYEKASGHVGGGDRRVADIRVEMEIRAVNPVGGMTLWWQEVPPIYRSIVSNETRSELVSAFQHGMRLNWDHATQAILARHIGPVNHNSPRNRRDGADGPVQTIDRSLSTGWHHVIFEHVDGTIRLSIDGETRVWEYSRNPDALTTMTELRAWAGGAGFSAQADAEAIPADRTYESDESLRRAWFPKLRIAVTGGAVEIRKLNVYRDLYYIAEKQGDIGGFSSSTKRDSWWRNVLIMSLNKNEYAMFGDNSPSSFDSRSWGPVDRKNFKGKAMLRWWPVTRWGRVK